MSQSDKLDALAAALGKAGALVALLLEAIKPSLGLLDPDLRSKVRQAMLDAGLDPSSAGLS